MAEKFVQFLSEYDKCNPEWILSMSLIHIRKRNPHFMLNTCLYAKVFVWYYQSSYFLLHVKISAYDIKFKKIFFNCFWYSYFFCHSLLKYVTLVRHSLKFSFSFRRMFISTYKKWMEAVHSLCHKILRRLF